MHRDVYPKALFERREKYGITVHMSRHPTLNTYIRELVEGMRDWIITDILKIAIILYDSSTGTAFERFIFDIGQSTNNVQKTLSEIEEAFRAFILRVQLFTSDKQLPKDSTFRVAVYKKGENNQIQNWIPVESDDLFSDPSIHALKSFDSGVIRLQLLVETQTNTDMWQG